MRKKFVFLFLLCSLSPLFAQSVEDTWSGTLDLGAQKLRIVFHVTATDDGYSSTMDSPDQGARGIPVKETTFDGTTLRISVPELMMSYEGALEGDIIKGIFRQGGLEFALNLERSAAVEPAKPMRPQTPEPPYPYNSEDITFQNDKAGITLAGTFTYPKTGRKFPAVVLISGSGAQNRNEELLEHKPFLVLSDYLTRNGIAVLRFDDRGTAESGGDYKSATIEDFATDASAAMEYLITRKEVDNKKIGLAGHSEGGQIAFIVGGERNDVAFIVTLASPGVKGEDVLKMQRMMIGLRNGATLEAINMNEMLVELIQGVVAKYGTEGLEGNLDSMVAEVIAAIPSDYPPVPNIETVIKGGIRQSASAELMSLLAYDPAEDLANIKAPILALNGDKDTQVYADQNLDGIQQCFSGDLTLKKYPGLNHLFQHAETGLSAEYREIEETISSEVLKDIAAWINEKMRDRKR